MSALEQAGKREAEAFDKREHVAPLVDVFENKDEILVLADLPGVDPTNVSIHFEKGHLAIGGRAQGFDYRRSFVVPSGIDADKITAKMEHGVLRVGLPKSLAAKPRVIEVKSG